MKHDLTATANALAAMAAISYVACVILVVLAPDLYFSLLQSWFHGLDLSKVMQVNVTLGSSLAGLITFTVAAWVTGYLFAAIYGWFAKK